jgi:drug/metabolite transporter (DMT)-like permease
MLGFCILAPMMDAFAKATPSEVPLGQILAARFTVQAAILVPLAWLAGLGGWPSRRDIALHLGRGFALLAATGCFFAAIRHMPIADALAIFFVEPFILTLMGAVFLKEAVGWRRLAACATGFAGALLVIRPGLGDLGLVTLLPLGTALLFAVYMFLTRSMSQRLHPVALQAHTALAACLLILPPLILMNGSGSALFDPIVPEGRALWTLAGVGVIATVSHLFITLALRFAPAATVAPLQYLEIVGATVIGFFAFGDFPEPLTWAGIAVIVASGLYVFARERARGAPVDRPPPPP